MTSIAAGHSHCLMTDGQRVWAMGSWLLSNGKKVHLPADFEPVSAVQYMAQCVHRKKASCACLHWVYARSACALNACGARAKLS